MRDFPIFTTKHGAASLVMREIPYQGAAYITLQDTCEPLELTSECADFCRICGAEDIFVTGHPALECLPVYTALWRMRAQKKAIGATDAETVPVRSETLELWREIYNKKIQAVPCGAWMTRRAGLEMLNAGNGYFIYRNGKILGIGLAEGDTIAFLASLVHGAGAEIVRALAGTLSVEYIQLTVASSNLRAVKLYVELGFEESGLLRTWYRAEPKSSL